MPISDLTGTTWIFSNTLTSFLGAARYNVEGTCSFKDSNGVTWSATSTSQYNKVAFTPEYTDQMYFFKGASGTAGTFPSISKSSLSWAWHWYGQAPGESVASHHYAAESMQFEITGGTDATNSTFINWIQANAKQVLPPLSVDLSTLSGWSNVSSGSHTLKVKAKATGYQDSALSEGASFTKAGSGYTGYVQPVNYRQFYIKINGTATESNYDYAFEYTGSNHSPEFTVLPGDYFTVYADGEECWLETQWGDSINVTGSPTTQTGAKVVTVTPTADNFVAAINTNW